MRVLLFAALVLGVARPARADREATPVLDRKLLSAAEVQHYFTPYEPAVQRCYLSHATNREAAGTLRLELIIHRDGSVFRFGFVAAGVRKPWLERLDRCLRDLSGTWRFPVRYGFTNAVLPFIYVKSHAPGIGPYESCWSPRGCPSKKGKR